MTVDVASAVAGREVGVAGQVDAALRLQGVYKRWGAKPVLEGIDLSVAAGELVSISGANGSGKTTLLRIAAGLIHADAGVVEIDSLDPEADRRAYLGRLGFLSAGDRGLYARVTTRRHLDLTARLALVAKEERAAAVERAIDVFGLGEFAERRTDRLSMGQRQRVRLAMTLVHDPFVVMLDEPANSLDQEGMEVLAGYLEDLHRRHRAAVWCVPDGVHTPLIADTALRLVDRRLQPA